MSRMVPMPWPSEMVQPPVTLERFTTKVSVPSTVVSLLVEMTMMPLATPSAKATAPTVGLKSAGLVAVPGAVQTLGVQASGRHPAGGAVQTRAVYFARGAQVFQAAVYGERLPPQALDAFFAGLRLPPP